MEYKHARNWVLSQWTSLIVMGGIVIILAVNIVNYDKKSDAVNATAIESIITKYAVQCYAMEGSYPPDLLYLTDNYGLIIDESRYLYSYEIFASNVLPAIKVVAK